MKHCPSCGARYEDAAKFCQHDGTLLRTVPGGAAEEDPYVGQVLIGQFEIKEMIGEGGMGRVYRAHQHGFDRQVAIKILHTDLVTNEEMVKRFNREAKIISRLDHPCIIHVYLFGELPDGNLYLAMEYVDGVGLTSLINDGPVAVSDALHIGRQILSALTEAHRKGVVHRDLKPDNIMLVKKADEPLGVKVLDFGIAKFLGSRTMLTQQGLVFGSARYISPEAAAGEPVDERADLYAVGVILYQMLAGRPPFDDASAVTLLMRHVNDPAPDILSQPGARGVPEPVAQVVMQALEKDPAHRFDGAAAMRAALTEAARAAGIVLDGAESVPPATSWAPPAPRAVETAPAPAFKATETVPAPAPKTAEARGEQFRTDPMFGGPKPAPPAVVERPRAKAPAGAGGAVAAGVVASTRETPRLPERPRPARPETSPAAPAKAEVGRDETQARQESPPPHAADPNDDEIDLPRSRAWLVLLVIAVLAIAGGALGALLAIETGPEPAEQADARPGDGAVAAVGAPAEPAEPPILPADAAPTPEESADAAALPATLAPATSPGPSKTAPPPGAADTPPPGAADTPPPGAAGGNDDDGMPPAASLAVEPRRPRAGQDTRLVAKVTPPAKLASPRFVISQKGAEPVSREATAGPGGSYAASHTFTKAGSYQVTFVAASEHGEVRAFTDAVVSAPAATRPPTTAPADGADPRRPPAGDDDDGKPPDGPAPPRLIEPWTAPVEPW